MYYIVGYMDNDKPNAIVSDEHGQIKMYSQGGDITSRSRGYKTLEELKQGEGVLAKPCVVCGGVVGTNFISNESMIRRNMCFSCNFWEDRIERKNDHNVFVINGIFYTDGGRKSPNSNEFLGFGGAEYTIETNDGRIISTNNLWYGGQVSKWYKDRFPDTAKFIR